MGAFVELGGQSLNGYERNKLYRNLGPGAGGVPRFADFGYFAGADRLEDGRAAAAFDLERDGDLDLVVQSYERPAVLLVNGGEGGGHWLEVQLTGTRSNRDAIGAVVTVTAGGRRQACELATSSGYLAGASLIAHFGLAAATVAELVEVDWPRGGKTVLRDVQANRRLAIVEGKGAEAQGRSGAAPAALPP